MCFPTSRPRRRPSGSYLLRGADADLEVVQPLAVAVLGAVDDAVLPAGVEEREARLPVREHDLNERGLAGLSGGDELPRRNVIGAN